MDNIKNKKILGVLILTIVLIMALSITYFEPIKTACAYNAEAKTIADNPAGLKDIMEGDNVYGYPKTDKKSNESKQDFVPYFHDNLGYGSFNFPDNFSSGRGQFHSNVTRILANNTKLDLTTFGTQAGEGNASDVNRSNNLLEYNTWSAAGNAPYYWMYMYGYVQVPDELAEKGGVLTVSAQTSIKYDDSDQAAFLSLVAGKGFYNGSKESYSETKITDLNATDMYMNHLTGQTSERVESWSKEFNPKEQKVSTIIKKGEKFARISFVQFVKTNGLYANNNFGQKITDVIVSYEISEGITITEPQNTKNDSVFKTGKSINFTASNPSAKGIKVKLKEDPNWATNWATIDIFENNITLKVNKNATYNVLITEQFENIVTNNNLSKQTTLDNVYILPIEVTNCHHFALSDLTAGSNVIISTADNNEWVDYGEEVIVTVKCDYGQNLDVPNITNAASLVEKYNYGIEAQYAVVFNENEDVTQQINAKFKKIQVKVNDVLVNYNESYTLTAKIDNGQEFVGWFVDGILVSRDANLTFYPTANIVIEQKTIAATTTKIEYYDYAGILIDVKVGDSDINALFESTKGFIKLNDIPFMDFINWELKGNKAYPIYSTNKKVIVNGKEYDYNTKQTIFASDGKVWDINGEKEFTFFAINDMTINEIEQQEIDQKPMVFVEKENARVVLSGMVNPKLDYREVGIIITDDINLTDSIFMLGTSSDHIMSIPITSMNNGQFMITTTVGKKARVYTIDNLGKIEYSNTINIIL